MMEYTEHPEPEHNILNNSQQTNNDSSSHSLKEDIVHYALLIYILPIIISNASTIFIYSKVKLLHTPSNCTIVNLAVADLLMGAIYIPITVGYHIDQSFFKTSYLLCFIAGPLHMFLFMLTVSMLMLLTIERYIAISFPYWYAAHMNVIKIRLSTIGLVFVDIFIMGANQYSLVVESTKTNNLINCDLANTPPWVVSMLFYAIVTQIIIMCICTVMVVILAFRSIKKLSLANKEKRNILKSDAKMTSGLMFLFVILFIPTIIVQQSIKSENLHYYSGIANNIILLNSILNVVVYAFSRKIYKIAFTFLLTNRPCKWGHVNDAVRTFSYRTTVVTATTMTMSQHSSQVSWHSGMMAESTVANQGTDLNDIVLEDNFYIAVDTDTVPQHSSDCEVHQTISSGKSHQIISSGKSHQTISSGKSHQIISSGKSHQAISSGKSHQTLSNGKSHQKISSGKSHQMISSAEADQTIRRGSSYH